MTDAIYPRFNRCPLSGGRFSHIVIDDVRYNLAVYPSGNTYVEAISNKEYWNVERELFSVLPLYVVSLCGGFLTNHDRGTAKTRSDFFCGDVRRLQQRPVDLDSLPTIIQDFLTRPY
jgi:hypothetical protein